MSNAKKQATFDAIARHLLIQMAKSMDADGRFCLYRGAGGMRCAVGALIPDDLYVSAMEATCAEDEPVSPLLRSLGYDVDVCQELQQIHDNTNVDGWYGALLDYASERGLSDAVLKEFR